MENSKNIDMQHISHKRLIDALEAGEFFAPLSTDEQSWYKILRLLPKGLQNALHDELTAGNHVTSIQFGDWPQEGSVIVSLADKFKFSYANGNSHNVTYHLINDPRYWIAGIEVAENGVHHHIIY